MKTITIPVNIEVVDELREPDIIATCFYPDDGNVIKVRKGLNTIELSDAIHHEIGHLIDWYISNGHQSECSDIREKNADAIGQSLRFKESSTMTPTEQLLNGMSIDEILNSVG